MVVFHSVLRNADACEASNMWFVSHILRRLIIVHSLYIDIYIYYILHIIYIYILHIIFIYYILYIYITYYIYIYYILYILHIIYITYYILYIIYILIHMNMYIYTLYMLNSSHSVSREYLQAIYFWGTHHLQVCSSCA